jgi:serine/threonine protein phosphatase 1
MSKTFVIGDIHGAYLALKQVLERSDFDYENDLLITIGDIVDGWSDSFMCVEELLKIKNRIDIIGNHDNFFLKFINMAVHPENWGQGGLSTAKSYAKAINLELKIQKTKIKQVRGNSIDSYMINLTSSDIPISHQQFFRKQIKLYKDSNNNIFVHGGFYRHLKANRTSLEIAMWDRNLWDNSLMAKDNDSELNYSEDINQIFIGHTATTAQGTDNPMKADKVWNIDTGAGAGGGGKLTIMDIETNEYWQSDNVPSLYPDDEHNIKNK